MFYHSNRNETDNSHKREKSVVSWTTGVPNVFWWFGIQKALYFHCILILFVMKCVNKPGKFEVENSEAGRIRGVTQG